MKRRRFHHAAYGNNPPRTSVQAIVHGGDPASNSAPVQRDGVAESFGQDHTVGVMPLWWFQPPTPPGTAAYVAYVEWQREREEHHLETLAGQRGYPRGHRATKRFVRRLLNKIERQRARDADRALARRLRDAEIAEAPEAGSEQIPSQISIVDMPIQPNAPSAAV